MSKEEKTFYNTNCGISTKSIILNSEGKLLTIRRTETAPSNPLKWDFPGGDIDIGEDPGISAVREIKEETGLTAQNPQIFDVEAHVVIHTEDTNIQEGKDLFWITLCYLVKDFSGDVALSYEHDLVKWVTPQEFLELPSPE